MPKFRTLDDLDVAGKRVLVRCDLNVPMKDGKVTDATRIERSAETLKALSGKGARVIVLSHFGRPKGKRARGILAEAAGRAAGQGARPQGCFRRGLHRPGGRAGGARR